jgi:hypothetical protein
MIGYDPTMPDSDGDGITDGNEDFDNDNISNVQELDIVTYMESEDSDGDHLNDGDELYIYGTDPLVPDSDRDGINDGDEVTIGKDPADGTDGTTRVSQTLTRIINNSEDPAITSVTVSLSVAGRIDRVLDVNDYYNVDAYSTDVYGRIGSPINFECDESFDTANVVITYDESKLGDALEENLGVLWFDESTGFYVIQEQAIVDTDNNNITLDLNHFSTYVLVDLEMWNNPILPDYSGDLFYRIYSFRPANGDATSISEEDEWHNCQAAYNNFNLIRLGGPFVDGKLIWGGFGWLGEYRFDWLIMDGTDDDSDCVPDYMETQGVIGTNRHIYYSDPTTEYSDEDTWSDTRELGNVFILVQTLYDGVKISLKDESRIISPILNEIYLEDWLNIVDYNRPVVFSFGTDPSNSDTDEDGSNDDVDAYPLVVNPMINYLLIGQDIGDESTIRNGAHMYQTILEDANVDYIPIYISSLEDFNSFWSNMNRLGENGEVLDLECYSRVDNMIVVCHGNPRGLCFGPSDSDVTIANGIIHSFGDIQPIPINVIDYHSCYSAYNGEAGILAEITARTCQVGEVYGWNGPSSFDTLAHRCGYYYPALDGYDRYRNYSNEGPLLYRLPPNDIYYDILSDGIVEVRYYDAVLHSTASMEN